MHPHVSPPPVGGAPREEEENLKLLIVDDDPAACSALACAAQVLGYSYRVARDGAEALALHEAEGADVILSDWRMPNMNGLELCRRVRASGPLPSDSGSSPNPYTYFIFVAADGDRDHFVEGMHAGADDYMTKPVDLDELSARLEAARRVVTLYRMLEKSNARLRRDSSRFFRAARVDALTTVSNRLRLKEDLEVLGARAARYGHRYSAAICDVDEFKAYNDHYGHLAGDEALRKVALAIRNALRRGDNFYRYGGDEFLAILPEQSRAEAVATMDRIRAAVRELEIPHAPSAAMPFVTVSVGVAELDASSTGGTDEWLGRADAALFAAKTGGRNRVEAGAEARAS